MGAAEDCPTVEVAVHIIRDLNIFKVRVHEAVVRADQHQVLDVLADVHLRGGQIGNVLHRLEEVSGEDGLVSVVLQNAVGGFHDEDGEEVAQEYALHLAGWPGVAIYSRICV